VAFGKERLHAESDLRVAAADALKERGVIAT
jgi:hypothetical protein